MRSLGHTLYSSDGAGPRFDVDVPAGGYAWWYVDAVADDDAHALTVIAFVGAAFSPAYFRARSRELRPDPQAHCALNVALYGPRARAWALSERDASSVVRTPDAFGVGGSRLAWDGGRLQIDLDERTPWLSRRIRGRIRVSPEVVFDRAEALDPESRHLWWCFAPLCRVEVELDSPRLRFSGRGYVDANTGREPLERSLAGWDWARASDRDGATLLYDTRSRDGVEIERAFRFDRRGRRIAVDLQSRVDLPRGRWGVARRIRCDGEARLGTRLEDGPFYTRSLVRTRMLASDVLAVHESISLDRFRHPLVRAMLPFRMRPRWRR